MDMVGGNDRKGASLVERATLDRRTKESLASVRVLPEPSASVRSCSGPALAEATPSTTKPFLATAKPTIVDRKRSLLAIVASIVLLAATAPFATIALPRFEAFIPSYESALTIVDLLTAVLLFSQFAILRR